MARPTKLTPEVQERVVKALKAGNRLAAAARFAGIDPATLHRWRERGDPEGTEPAGGPYREFAAQVDQAIAEAEVRDVSIISKAAESDWRAAAWRLSRRHAEQWGNHTQRESNTQGSGLPQHAPGLGIGLLAELPDELLEQLAHALGIREQRRANAGPNAQTALLSLPQAIWDELYKRKVPITSQDHQDWGHNLLQALASGSDVDASDLQMARDQVAKRHGLPPRPG